MVSNHPLPYYGGKHTSRALSHWIASHLPTDRGLYVEPFCGMCGILLLRPPARLEIINDTNGDVVNLWRCLREHHDELERLVVLTPNSREEFKRAIDYLPSGEDPIRRAHAFHTVLSQSFSSKASAKSCPTWSRTFDPTHGNEKKYIAEGFSALAERLRHVQIENIDALKLLERTASIKDAIIYCDPPYKSADHRAYGEVSIDWSKFEDLLQSQKGFVALSGYESDGWDRLDWFRNDFACKTPLPAHDKIRIEVLWTNQPTDIPIQPDLFSNIHLDAYGAAPASSPLPLGEAG